MTGRESQPLTTQRLSLAPLGHGAQQRTLEKHEHVVIIGRRFIGVKRNASEAVKVGSPCRSTR